MSYARICSRSLVIWLSAAVLLSLAAVASAAPEEIIIVYTNDLHGHLLPVAEGDTTVGGLARLAAEVAALRAANGGRVLWLDAGDALHGSNLATLLRGEPVVDVLSMAGLNVMAVGNHDFNYGAAELRRLAGEAAFAVLAANVHTADGEPFLSDGVVLTVGGLRVAVFGLSSPETPTLTHPRNVEGLVFADPIQTAKELVARLAAEADLVVAVTHTGFEYDRLLAGAVSGIDVVVGGHSHTRLDEPVVENGTLIVQAQEWGRFLGVLHLWVDAGEVVSYEGRLIPIGPHTPEDERIAAAVAGWEQRLDDLLQTEIGATAVDLDGERDRVRTAETNLGNLIADAVRHAVGADVAFVNGGAIRQSVPQGPISLGMLRQVLPFENTIVVAELTGAELLVALETSVAHYPSTDSGAFLQVSGLRYTFSPSAPAGDRIGDVQVAVQGEWVPLDPAAVYRVAINDFLAAGGDGYDVFAAASQRAAVTDDGLSLIDAVQAYITSTSPVAPQTEGRIQVVP